MKIVKLSEVCEVLDSKRIPVTANNRKKGIYPYYGANGIQDYVSDYIFDDELVLLAEDGGNFGSKDKPIAYRVSGKCWVNNHAHVLKPRDNINVDYLCDALKFYDVTNIINGATRKKLTQAAMLGMQIPLPDLDKQNKISLELKTCTTIIEKHRKLISKYDTLIKSRFIEMFGDPVQNPMKWEIKPMGELLSLLTDFSSNGSYKTLDSNVIMYDEPNYALMIRTTDLESGDFSNNVKWVDEKAYNLLSKSKVFGKEIIMNKIGSAGKVYLMPELNRPVTLGRNAFLFRYKENINSVYIYFLLTSEYGQNEIKPYIRGAVTKTITKDDARKIRIPVPPITLQNKFENFVQQIDKSKFAVQKSLEKAETLYKSLMQEYFG